MPQRSSSGEGNPVTPLSASQLSSPGRLFFVLVSTIFTAELLVMSALHFLHVDPLLEIFIDSLSLVLMLMPVLLITVIRPMQSRLDDIARAEQSLIDSLHWHRGIVDAAFEGILITDERGVIKDANPAIRRIFGRSQDELIGANMGMLIPEDFRQRHEKFVASFVHDGEQRVMGLNRVVHGLRKDGTVFPLEIAITELSSGGIRHFVAMMRDITQRQLAEAALRQAHDELEQRVRERTTELLTTNAALQHEIKERARMQEELQRLASTDTLTGIRNRRVFEAFAQQEISRSERYGDPLSLILFDIDHFKAINDTYGHHVGDEVLVQVAELVGGRIRASEIFARWGGEEFMILLPQTDLANATRLAEELRDRLADQPLPPVGIVTASFGVSQFVPGDTLDSMMHRVDTALYRAKEMGRNRVEKEAGPEQH